MTQKIIILESFADKTAKLLRMHGINAYSTWQTITIYKIETGQWESILEYPTEPLFLATQDFHKAAMIIMKEMADSMEKHTHEINV